MQSPKWLENKRATINPRNNDHKCFQYAITVALNYNKFKQSDLQWKLNIKPINQYDIKNKFFITLRRLGKIWRKQLVICS